MLQGLHLPVVYMQQNTITDTEHYVLTQLTHVPVTG